MGAPTPMNLVITGSSRGIGRFRAESLAKRGHEVCRLVRLWPDGFSFLLSRFSLFAFHVTQ
jgi:nucleoside-diphosphate-sugar epimerase